MLLLLLQYVHQYSLILSFKQNYHRLRFAFDRTDVWKRKLYSSTTLNDLLQKNDSELALTKFSVLSKGSVFENISHNGYHSKFLAPSEYSPIKNSFKPLDNNYNFKIVGGHLEAERRRFVLLEDSKQGENPIFVEDNSIWAIEVKTMDTTINVTSLCIRSDGVRTALGSILSIETNHFGDVVLPGRKNLWQIFVTKEVVNKVMELNTSLSGVSLMSLPIEYIKIIDRKDVLISSFNEKKLTINEASNRLDAVASGGFGISRNRMTKLIAAGEVMIDWKVITNAATNVKRMFYGTSHITQRGQLIVAGDLGQVRIEELGITSKGRRSIKVTRRTRSKGPGSILT